MYFTFVFFGPFEITIASGGSILIVPSEVISIMFPLCILLTIVSVFVLSFVRGKLFDIIICGFSYLLIGGYIQGNLVNESMGLLTGTSIEWNKLSVPMITGLCIWLFLLLVLIVGVYFDKNRCFMIIKFISIALVIMQGVALVPLISNSISEDKFFAIESLYISKEDMFLFSETDNTIVFLVDTLDYEFIDGVRVKTPEFFNSLDGFVEYTNVVPDFSNTRPGGASLLGNTKEAFTMPTKELYEKIFKEDQNNVFTGLQSAGYVSDVYANLFYLTNNSEGQIDKIESIKKGKNPVNKKEMINKLLDLSIYRYAPLAIKPFYWTHTDEINNNLRLNGDGCNNNDETVFDLGIDEITLDQKKRFKFYHFTGSHEPYTLTDKGIRSDVETDAITQTKGCFEIIYRAIDKMKELGIYENASIIIAADHGFPEYPLTKAKRVGVFYKESGKAEVPLEFNDTPVMLNNIPATILKASEAEYKYLGIPLDEVTTESYVNRIHRSVVHGQKESELYVYSVGKDASNYDNWELLSKDFIEKSYWY